jgi:hypothetical protein
MWYGVANVLIGLAALSPWLPETTGKSLGGGQSTPTTAVRSEGRNQGDGVVPALVGHPLVLATATVPNPTRHTSAL